MRIRIRVHAASCELGLILIAAGFLPANRRLFASPLACSTRQRPNGSRLRVRNCSQNSGCRRNRNRRHASPPMQVVCIMGVKMTKLPILALFAAAISLAAISAASAAPPTKTGTTAEGRGPDRRQGHDALHLRQGCRRQVGLQRSVRDQLAGAEGRSQRQGRAAATPSSRATTAPGSGPTRASRSTPSPRTRRPATSPATAF